MTCDDDRLYYLLDYVVWYLNGPVRRFQQNLRSNHEEDALRPVDTRFKRLNEVFSSHGISLQIVDRLFEQVPRRRGNNDSQSKPDELCG